MSVKKDILENLQSFRRDYIRWVFTVEGIMFEIENGKIKFQRGYWDKLSFLRQHKLPIPSE